MRILSPTPALAFAQAPAQSGVPAGAAAPRRRRARPVLAAVAAVVTVLGVQSVPGGAARAAGTELAVNELAPQITDAAQGAVRAFDTYAETGQPGDLARYDQLRDETARLVARQVGYPEDPMVAAWHSASTRHQRAVLAAVSQVGVPYRSNASVEGEAFDCSGLTGYAWAEAGVGLDRISGDQIRGAAGVGREAAQAGDLVYYPGHVMMYLGVGDAIVHAIGSGRTVEVDTLSQRHAGSARFGDPTG